MNRRKFLQASTIAVAGVVLGSQLSQALAQTALEGEDLAKFDAALQKALGKGYADLTPTAEIKLVAPTIAESGANVPVEIDANFPSDQVKAIHCFCDRNPTPLLFSVYPSGVAPYYATRIRIAESAPVRAVVETKDGKLWLASQTVRVTVGGCG